MIGHIPAPLVTQLPRNIISSLVTVIEVALAERSGRALARDLRARVGTTSSRSMEVQLQALTQAGILRSRRGPSGGYVLGKPPKAISCGDIIRATCEAQSAKIPIHPSSRAIDTLLRLADAAYQAQLDSVTVADLVAEMGSDMENSLPGNAEAS